MDKKNIDPCGDSSVRCSIGGPGNSAGRTCIDQFGLSRFFSSGYLVLLQENNLGYSVPVVFRSKAQCAGNGQVLAKHCKASASLLSPLAYVRVGHTAAGHHRSARRVGLSASMALLRLLQRTKAICGEARLALNADRPTVSQIISLKEHRHVSNY